MSAPFRYIIFESTQACNLMCRYCYNVWHAIPELKHAPSEKSGQAFKTLKKIIKALHPGHITFTGGEPFLEPRLKEMALYSRMKKTEVSIISNGTRGTMEDYKDLASLGILHLQFPLLSASPEIHDALTGVSGSWHRAKASLQQAAALEKRAVAVFVLTKRNYTEFAATVALLAQMGVTRLMMARFNIGGRGILFKDELIPDSSMIRSVFKQADTFAHEGIMRISSNVCLPLCIINPADYPHIRISTCSPDISRKPVTIDVQGNLRLCNHSPVIAGNIYRDTIEDILANPYIRQWESQVPAFCSDCSQWKKCLGGCRAASEQLGGSLMNEDPWIKTARTESLCYQ